MFPVRGTSLWCWTTPVWSLTWSGYNSTSRAYKHRKYSESPGSLGFFSRPFPGRWCRDANASSQDVDADQINFNSSSAPLRSTGRAFCVLVELFLISTCVFHFSLGGFSSLQRSGRRWQVYGGRVSNRITLPHRRGRGNPEIWRRARPILRLGT